MRLFGLFEIPTFEIGEKRNTLAAVFSSFLFFTGWWIAIDTAAIYTNKEDILDTFYICGVFATISMFMVNSVSNRQLRGEQVVDGFLGTRGASLWFFLGYLIGFGSLIGASYILFGEYLSYNSENTFKPSTSKPGVGIFMQNILIFASSVIYKFGRLEEDDVFSW